MTTFFLTYEIPAAGMELLRSRGTVRVHPDAPRTRESILAGCQDADALICMLTDPIDAQLIEELNVRAIGTMAVGTNNIDLETATRREIPVVHTPGVLTEASADLAWALLMAVARRTVEADRFVRDDRFRGWEAMTLLGSDLYGATLGVVGFGRIGQAMARRARGFGMKVLVHNRTPRPEIERELGVESVTLDDLLTRSDIVTLHVPLTPKTERMINAQRIAQMKPTAILINTARGEVMDEDALLSALDRGHLTGVGLDVFDGEPGPIDSRWMSAPRAVLSPHIGSATHGTRGQMSRLVAQGVIDILDGSRPAHLANPEAWR
ncbi:MAG: D-glycerate dehydrogenase [Deltaproteobacteria bacterium]|nr:D-glycerate dehydrogenase [Deltaproteobacteria bacterium]